MDTDRDDAPLSPEEWKILLPKITKRILRTLERARGLTGIHHEDLAEWLQPHLKPHDLVAIACHFENVARHMKLDWKKCAVCGKEIERSVDAIGSKIELRIVRADARYCSAKCRQKAYRENTARRSRANGKPSHVTASPVQSVLQA